MAQNQSKTQAALDALNELDQMNSDLQATEVPSIIEDQLPETAENQGPVQRMTPEEFDGTMSELNKFVGSIYEDMGEIDPIFTRTAKFCQEMADEWAEVAEKKGKGLNSDEGKIALTVAAIGFAANGLGILKKTWEKQKNVWKYQEICAKIAKSKGPHIDNMLNLAHRAVSNALEDFEVSCDQQIDASIAYANSKNEAFKAIKDLLIGSLNRYRQAQYVFDQIVWLRDQMIAWNEGKLDDTTSQYPSYQAINNLIFFTLHPFKEKASSEAKIQEIQVTCTNVVNEYIKMVNQEYDMVSATYVMSLCDNELMATLLLNCNDNTKYELLDAYQAIVTHDISNSFASEFTDSDAIKTTYDLCIEKINLINRENKHVIWMIINGVLLLMLGCFPVIFKTDWGWGWKLFDSILIGIPIIYKTIKAVGCIQEKTQIKAELIERWQHSSIEKMTGYRPISKSITRVQNGIWLTIICAVIGGVVGSFFFHVIGTIVGACIGALIGGNDEDEEQSNGSNWKSFNTGSFSKTIVWTIIICALFIYELYWIFG